MDRENPELTEANQTMLSATDPIQIEGEMAATRQSLTDKVAALEESVKSSVAATTAAVGETVDKMGQMFDVTRYVRETPWTSVSVAAGLGLITSLLLPRRAETVTPAHTIVPVHAPTIVPRSLVAETAPPSRPNVFDQLFERAGQELKKLGESVIDRVTSELHRAVDDGIPKLVDKLPFVDTRAHAV